MFHARWRLYLNAYLFCLLTLLLFQKANGATYVGAGGSRSIDAVVHPVGYDGSGGELIVTIGLHQSFAHLASDIDFSANQTVAIWNNLIATTGNLKPSVEIPAIGGTDVFGVLIHEVGHALGLAHPTIQVSGLGDAATSTTGLNQVLDIGPGVDALLGTADDVRGDDISLNYFNTADNNPFTLPASGIIDSTSYSRDITKLPAGDRYPVIGHRDVASSGYMLENTMAIMTSGGSLIPGLVRRGLVADDVAGIRYAMSGLDEIQGTSDDYTIKLVYVGVDSSADIVIRFDRQSGYAATGISAQPISGNHWRLRPGRVINYNPNLPNNRAWYFPVIESKRVEIRDASAASVNLRLATEAGKRYAIAWSPTLQEGSWSAREVSSEIGGKPIEKTGADFFLFIAEDEETIVNIDYLDTLSASAFFSAYQVLGKELN